MPSRERLDTELLAGLKGQQVGCLFVLVGQASDSVRKPPLERIHHTLGEILTDPNGRQVVTEFGSSTS